MPGVVLVEGESDKAAVLATAEKLGRDLGSEGVEVVAAGGVGKFARHLRLLDSAEVAGLYDQGEEAAVIRSLAIIGLPPTATRTDLEELGFHVCVEDLEDELIRALGANGVLEVIETAGELSSFRKMQGQPQWEGRPLRDQMRRFLGTRAGRKVRYGRLLVEALAADEIPLPLERLLEVV